MGDRCVDTSAGPALCRRSPSLVCEYPYSRHRSERGQKRLNAARYSIQRLPSSLTLTPLLLLDNVLVVFGVAVLVGNIRA